MASIMPLPVYPGKPTGDDLELLKQAKVKLGTDLLITPVRAVNGSPGRVIALREKPTWLCEYAFVPEPNVESLTNALAWALGLREDKRGVTIIKVLREIFGARTREL